MMRNIWIFAIGASCALPLACGGPAKEAEKEAAQADEKQEEAIEGIARALQQPESSSGENKVETVDFRLLKELLPETLIGMKRVGHTGERGGALGFSLSQAQASYEKDNSRLEVNITDVGGMNLALAALASWATLELDRETESGYERTVTIDGAKAFERYDRDSKEGELSMLVDNRFIVTVRGDNLPEADFRRALREINLKKLPRG
jgi:hypothetical protein